MAIPQRCGCRVKERQIVELINRLRNDVNMFERYSSTLNVVAATILFLGINILSNQLLVDLKVDMTSDKLYTLSSGTKAIIKSIEDPIDLKFYFSTKQFSGIPELKTHGQLTRDMLEEYVASSKGKLNLLIIDPEPFSEAEDEARHDGIRRIPLSPGRSGYLGVVATDSTTGKITIPFLKPDDEIDLEYDLSKLILDLSKPERKKVGLISSLPVLGSTSIKKQNERAERPWAIYQLLDENYEIIRINYDSREIPDGIDVLLVLHPKNLPESTEVAIEKYTLKGGKLIIFVDPFAEADPTAPDPSAPGVIPNLSSNPKKLLAKWGVEMASRKVIVDPSLAVNVNFGTPEGPRKILYLPWLQLRPPHISLDSLFTRGLSVLNVGSAGSLQVIGETTTLKHRILLSVTENSGLMDSQDIIKTGNPSDLLNKYEKDKKYHAIAIHVSDGASNFKPATSNNNSEHRTQVRTKNDNLDVLIIADTDMLSNRFWIDGRRFASSGEIQAISSNANFLLNAIELYGGRGELINLRNRGKFSRPFKLVEELRRKAESKHREQEKELRAKLEETENRLEQIEQSSDGMALLTEDQKNEIDQFRSEQKKTRKELRSVQHKLIREIEQLGNALKIINIGLIPFIILSIGLVVGIRKAYK